MIASPDMGSPVPRRVRRTTRTGAAARALRPGGAALAARVVRIGVVGGVGGVGGALAVIMMAATLGGCRGPASAVPPARLIRLGNLLAASVGSGPAAGSAPASPAGKSAAVAATLPPGEATPEKPYEAVAELSAGRVGRLRLEIEGTSHLATVSWRLAQDRIFSRFRAVSFPLAADGKPHSYEVDLEREAHWHGRVEGMRVGVDEGRIRLGSFAALASADPYRSMSLGGETMPSLAGGGRIELPLPAGLAAGTAFEAHLGLIPEYDRNGVTGVFRATLEDRQGRHPWFEERLDGGSGKGPHWLAVRRPLPESATGPGAPAGDAGGGGAAIRLVLEASATEGGDVLPEGAVVWGNPLLVQPGRPPGRNLVVILVDTLRADEVGIYGGGGLTPRIDAFARQGVRFAEMLSPAPWTLPSVCSLLTGLQPQTHGAGQRFGDLEPSSARQNEFAPVGLPSGVSTLAGVLGSRGFYSLAVYQNFYILPGFGVHQGFDEYTSVEDRAEVLVDRALERLRATSGDRRTFLYLHLFDLHSPYDPPEPECSQVARRQAPAYHGRLGCEGDRNPERTTIPPPGDRPWFHALYRAEVAYTDRQVGRFLAGLHGLGLDDDTVVALVSDHGEEFWSRLPQEEALGYETNSDHGHTLYQELVHVPAMVRIPGRPPAVVADPVQLVDLFPTLLRAVGIEPPASQGSDLTPLLDGRPATSRPTFVADVVLRGRPRWSVRRGPWKLVAARDPALPVELYDLGHDPAELTNLASRMPRLAADLRAWGERELLARQAAKAQFLHNGDILGATYLEWRYITKLRALGYLK
jgi:arylsulfatase A-like enzyme